MTQRSKLPTLALSTALVWTLAAGAAAQQAGAPPVERRVALPQSGLPASLAVRLHWGRITVRPHEADDVRFEVTEDEPGDSLRSLTPPSGYEVRRLENRVELAADPPGEGSFRALNVVVYVPDGLDIKLEMERGGDIVVEGVAASLEISNRNGSVRLDGIDGDALVDARNGEVRADFRQLTPGRPLTFATLNGGVYVTLPAGTAADLQVVSATGDVRTDFPVQVDETLEGPVASRGPAKGRATIDVRGRINGGGPMLYIQTHNGPVRLLQGEG